MAVTSSASPEKEKPATSDQVTATTPSALLRPRKQNAARTDGRLDPVAIRPPSASIVLAATLAIVLDDFNGKLVRLVGLCGLPVGRLAYQRPRVKRVNLPTLHGGLAATLRRFPNHSALPLSHRARLPRSFVSLWKILRLDPAQP